MVLKQGFVFLLSVTCHFIIKIVAPNHGEMIVQQMLAYADLHAVHQQLIVLCHIAVRQNTAALLIRLVHTLPPLFVCTFYAGCNAQGLPRRCCRVTPETAGLTLLTYQ